MMPILPAADMPAILALSLLRKISRALNTLSTGLNHQNYNYIKPMEMQYQSQSQSDADNMCECGRRRHLSIHAKSTHAEEMAIDKLIKTARKNRKTSRKIIDVSIMIIRVSSKGTPDNFRLSNSKPCSNCLHKISELVMYGYRVTKIYYSGDNNEIVESNIQQLTTDQSVRPSSFYRNANLPTYLRSK